MLAEENVALAAEYIQKLAEISAEASATVDGSEALAMFMAERVMALGQQDSDGDEDRYVIGEHGTVTLRRSDGSIEQVKTEKSGGK